MQLDVDIEPTLRLPHMTSIDKQMDKSEGCYPQHFPCYKHLSDLHFYHRQTDRKRRIRAHRATCTGGLNKLGSNYQDMNQPITSPTDRNAGSKPYCWNNRFIHTVFQIMPVLPPEADKNRVGGQDLACSAGRLTSRQGRILTENYKKSVNFQQKFSISTGNK